MVVVHRNECIKIYKTKTLTTKKNLTTKMKNLTTAKNFNKE